MKVLITGAMGSIGRVVSAHLRGQGLEVRLIDLVEDVKEQDYAVCDVMDFEGLQKHMQGCEAVVHLAALKNPHFGTSQDIFRINTAGTFNVFEAAAQVGIRRIVQASSINAIGCGWNLGDYLPQYLPMDEEHPSVTTDPYALSKKVVEDIGAYYWRRDGISSIALRFPGVFPAEFYLGERYREWRGKKVAFLDEFTALPEAEQQRQLAEVRKLVLSYRAQRSMEYPAREPKPVELNGIHQTLWHLYAFDRYYLWTLLDERDAVQAIEKSLLADYSGSHPLFVNDHHNSLGYNSQKLVELFFPQQIQWKQTVRESESLVSIERARSLIGFEPAYSVET